MTITVNGPGGITINFPDGTDSATIHDAMAQATGQSDGATSVPDLGAGHAGMAGLIQGATLGWADQLSGAAAGAEEATLGALSRATGLELGPAGSQGSFQTGYDRGVQGARQELASASANHPRVYGVGQIAGALATLPLAPSAEILPAAAEGASLAARVLPHAVNAAATGTLYGAVQGAGYAGGDLGNRIEGAGEGGLLGGGAGLVLGGTLGTAAEALAGRAARLQRAGPDIGQASQDAGIYVPAYIASNDPVEQQIGAAAKSAPVSGTRMVNATDRMFDEFGQAGQEVGAQYGGGDIADPATAGQAARQSLNDAIAARSVNPDNVRDVAAAYGGGVSSDVPSAGAGARSGLENWIGPASEEIANRAYADVGNLVDPTVTTPLNNTTNAAIAVLSRRANMGVAGPGGAVGVVRNSLQRPGGLNFQGIQDLRGYIRPMLDTPSRLPADINEQELRQVYNGLTQDLGAAAENGGGPAGLLAWQRANNLYADISRRRELLDRVLGTSSPEGVFNKIVAMAGTGKAADMTTLAEVQRSMPADAWNGIASGAINQMLDKATSAGTTDLGKFFTQWNAFSPEGRAALFAHRLGPSRLADTIDAIATQHAQVTAARRTIADILDAHSPEAAFSTILGKAGTGRDADISTLMKLKNTISPSAWDNVASATVHHMLNLSPSTAAPSMDAFFTAWNKLSPTGRRLLFGNQPEQAARLTAMAELAGRAKKVKATYSNTSGTAQVGGLLYFFHLLGNPKQWPAAAAMLFAGRKLTQGLTRPARPGGAALMAGLGSHLPNPALYSIAAQRRSPPQLPQQ